MNSSVFGNALALPSKAAISLFHQDSFDFEFSLWTAFFCYEGLFLFYKPIESALNGAEFVLACGLSLLITYYNTGAGCGHTQKAVVYGL